MRRRDRWLNWIRSVERESHTTAFALELLRDELQRDPSLLTRRSLQARDFAETVAHREATYLLRLFAEFENGLRAVWSEAYGEITHPNCTDLLNAFAARRQIPSKVLRDAHRVRIYRNRIVHDEAEPADPLSLEEARQALCRFFSYLPENW